MPIFGINGDTHGLVGNWRVGSSGSSCSTTVYRRECSSCSWRGTAGGRTSGKEGTSTVFASRDSRASLDIWSLNDVYWIMELAVDQSSVPVCPSGSVHPPNHRPLLSVRTEIHRYRPWTSFCGRGTRRLELNIGRLTISGKQRANLVRQEALHYAFV